MSGNTIGKCFAVTTFGESHGKGIGAIIDGCPSGIVLSEADIQPALDKRKPGQSKYTTQRRENDTVEILSGVFDGLTTGAPIALWIRNEDAKSKDYESIKNLYRPGHADFTYHKKYGHRDYRGGGRASARETVARVAAGAIASKILKESYGINIISYLSQVGDIVINFEDEKCIMQNAFFCPNSHQISNLENKIDLLRREGDSIGAKITVIASNIPVGLGEPVFDKLDAALAYAMMSINAVKGVEIGAGFNAITQKGSEHRDEMDENGFITNHAGGILGGISTGQDLIMHIAFKPTSSIVKPGLTQDINGNVVEVSTKGRHDPCVGIRAVPIVTAMMALVLIDYLIRFRGYQ